MDNKLLKMAMRITKAPKELKGKARAEYKKLNTPLTDERRKEALKNIPKLRKVLADSIGAFKANLISVGWEDVIKDPKCTELSVMKAYENIPIQLTLICGVRNPLKIAAIRRKMDKVVYGD